MSSAEELKDAVLDKLRTDPLSITTQDALRLSDQIMAVDDRSAKIVSAVNSLAVVSEEIKDLDPRFSTSALSHDPGHTQAALVTDLNAAVDRYPGNVTPEILKTVQGIVTKMQRAIVQNNAPHPELEAELQAKRAEVGMKIVEGTVTKSDADGLHSLEARAHGHTEKGGVTALAQSAVAKRERKMSLGGESSTHSTVTFSKILTYKTHRRVEKHAELLKADKTVRKTVREPATTGEADQVRPRDTRTCSHAAKDGPAARAQSMPMNCGCEREGSLRNNSNIHDDSGDTNDTNENTDDTASIQVQRGDFPVPARSSGDPINPRAALTIDEVKVTDLRKSSESVRPRKSSESKAPQAY